MDKITANDGLKNPHRRCARVVVPDDGPFFSVSEVRLLERLNRSLFEAFFDISSNETQAAGLRCYLDTMTGLASRYRMFEIANHRIFRTDDALIVPYDAHGRLSVHVVRAESQQVARQLRLPHGTMLTDEFITDMAGLPGEAIDLELLIYHLDIDTIPAVKVSHLRDLIDVLERLNRCGSRHEAVYLMRFLVARFCSTTFQGVTGAKNLQPEIARVRESLIEFLNGPFAGKLSLPTRILVRQVSDLVSQPKLIDEVWQNTIDLAEVHIRGSAIAKEIRRGTHHSMGPQTLMLARAYLQWLQTGQADFPDPERERPTASDEAARSNPGIVERVMRIVDNLEHLLGGTQISERLSDWRQTYAAELLVCDSGRSLAQEFQILLEQGIRARNRWVYLQRLRVIRRKANNGRWAVDVLSDLLSGLDAIEQALPDDDEFPAERIAARADGLVMAFCNRLRRDHQDSLFGALERVLADYEGGRMLEAFKRCSALRHDIEDHVGCGVFGSQRLLLQQLDCILEELGYFALRHLASEYEEHGLVLDECLGILRLCASNLVCDGLFSRELWDLTCMLVEPGCAPAERLDVLNQIQRCYHRIVSRMSEAYEVMADHLGYSDDEMRAVIGNLFRTMHDLNSLVHFSDIARTHISRQLSAEMEDECAEWSGDPWEFIHLSDTDDIARRVEDWEWPSLRRRYGGKGSGLIYIAYLGIPTRDAFIIPSSLPRAGLHESEADRFDAALVTHLHRLEADIGRNEGKPVHLGDPDAPLLLAVRGGSVFSMPGMLETVVFAGMTTAVAEALAREDAWYAWDSLRRFLASYASAVWHIDLEHYDLVDAAKHRHGVLLKADLPANAMREIVEESKSILRDAGHGRELEAILSNAGLQFRNSVQAVIESWNGTRARRYREIKHLGEGWHTAVIVQQMASGNRLVGGLPARETDETGLSLTGVIPMTRMQSTGFRTMTGDVKYAASGDDLVGGLTEASSFEPVQLLHARTPMLERKLNHICARLRRFQGSDAEVEFTVEQGVLSVLQTRSAEVELGFSPITFADPGLPAGRGIGIRGGAFRGLVAFNEDDARRLGRQLDKHGDHVDGVLLVLDNPVPHEIPLILEVDGLLAAKGGSTAHAAVAVNGIEDKPYSAVLGVPELRVDRETAIIIGSGSTTDHRIHAGDVLSIHGHTGEVFVGSRAVRGVGDGER